LGEGCHAQSSWLCDTTSSRIHVNNLSQPEPAAIDHQRRFSGPPFSFSGFVGGRVGWGSWLNNRNHRSAGIASVDDFIPRRFGSLHRDLADRARSWWFKFGRVSWHDNLQRRKPRSGMRRWAGPLEVGLTPRCVLPAPQPRTLKSRIQRKLQVISSQLFGHGRLNQLYGRESQNITAANRCAASFHEI